MHEAVRSFLDCYTQEEIASTSNRDWNRLAEDWGKTSSEKNEIIKEIRDIAKKYRKNFFKELSFEEKSIYLFNSVSNVIRTLSEEYTKESFEKSDLCYQLNVFRGKIKSNHKLRDSIIETLKELDLDNHFDFEEYPYFTFILLAICEFEIYYINEIKEKDFKTLISTLSSFGDGVSINDEINKGLSIYKDIEYYASKEKAFNSLVSDRWCIDAPILAKIYRKLFDLTKQAIKY